MHDRLDLVQGTWIITNDLFERLATYRPFAHHIWEGTPHRGNRRSTFGVKLVHGDIGIPDRTPLISKHGSCRGFAHPDRSCKTKAERHRKAAARVALSTVGRVTNQRSKAGTA